MFWAFFLGALPACGDSGGEPTDATTATTSSTGVSAGPGTTVITEGATGDTELATGAPEPTTAAATTDATTTDATTTTSDDTTRGDTTDGDTQPADFWIPGKGEITNINQNSGSEVEIDGGVPAPMKWYNGFYGGNSFAGMARAWNGAVWADGYSEDGALVHFGGGHGANIGCFSYLFDVTSRRWKQVGAELNLPAEDMWSGGHPYGSVPDARDPLWLDYDHQGSRIIVLAHQYATVSYLAPDEGGAPVTGSLLTANAEGDQTASKPSAWGSWTFDLTDGRMERSLAGEPGPGISSGSLIAVKDTVNRKLWYFAQGKSEVRYHDLDAPVPRPLETTTRAVEPGAPNDGYTIVYDVTWLFVPEAKAALLFQGTGEVDSGLGVYLVDFASGTPTMAAVDIPFHPAGATGFAHGALNVGAAWDSKRQRVVLYEGLGDAFTHVLTPSSTDFRAATWTWSRESYGGREPANGQGPIAAADSMQGAWGRWRYVPTLDVFLWTDGPGVTAETEDGATRDAIVQFWAAEGTPM